MAHQLLLAAQRQSLVLEATRRAGAVRVAELVEQFGVSNMTIRRDLDALARQGAVQKVRGGAMAAATASTDRSGVRAEAEAESARPAGPEAALARAAAKLVAPGSVVALSGGSAMHAVASRLLEIPRLTIVTNSLPIADLVRAAGSNGGTAAPQLLLTGGTLNRSATLVGVLAEQTIRSLHVDLLILGAHGVCEEAGLTAPDLAEAQTNRLLIASARRTVVVADHSKWGIVGLSSFAALNEVDCLVTDEALPLTARKVLANSVRELVLVPTSGHGDVSMPEDPEAASPRPGRTIAHHSISRDVPSGAAA
ncbi:DeoR/GlpR family DNA-binding transcription regulator [Streptomyces sp. LS1784]|uniref:DeoR/GlpR family DNA-binding transcription regulator n=1 Tax=Streptomyces sp. LS1784 TaxID=2851533 RepID=UPI001CCEC8E1|nr:DeoR/GlpR family DNA-binding transcription regulator [Streptomyces sp. LS1784]